MQHVTTSHLTVEPLPSQTAPINDHCHNDITNTLRHVSGCTATVLQSNAHAVHPPTSGRRKPTTVPSRERSCTSASGPDPLHHQRWSRTLSLFVLLMMPHSSHHATTSQSYRFLPHAMGLCSLSLSIPFSSCPGSPRNIALLPRTTYLQEMME